MKKRISLNGVWLLKKSEFASGERFGLHIEKGTSDWLPGHVPGDVFLDLMSAGLIPDVFYGLNIDHCIWVEEKDWWYRTNFQLGELTKLQQNQRVFLLFYGLDTFANVYLNGEKIAQHDNMFIPLRIDVTAKVRQGENDLRVCLASPAYSPDYHREPIQSRMPPQRLFSRKAQACYGWDIAPRLVTIGIWRPVEIVICDEIEIIDPWVQTKWISKDEAEVELQCTLRHYIEGERLVKINIQIYDQKRTINLKLNQKTTRISETFQLSHPPLWWPHNHGKPQLLEYCLQVEVESIIMDEFSGRFGVRTVEMVEEPLGEDRRSLYFRINNKPIFLKGMNWTPSDAIYARITPERVEKLINIAIDSNVNALRVWGGGIYESDDFYNLCDEKGILVWQDFMFACGIYPQNEEFLFNVREEAEYVVRSLRSHPSIFIWCGDNEVDWVYIQEKIPKYWENRINREVLPKVCQEFDPTRPYIPSTPFSHEGDHPNDSRQGDVHLWKHGSSYREDFYAKCYPNLVTEIGHISLPDLKVLKSFIPEEKLWPPFNEYWHMHCSDPLRSGESYRVQSYFDSIKNNGLPRPETVKELISQTQLLQTEATIFWIEHFSSQPNCWGIFLWNLCDCWPQISDAYIAYPFEVKPALSAVKEEYGKISR